MASYSSISSRTLKLYMSVGEGETVMLCNGRLIVEPSSLLKNEVKPLLVNKRRVILDFSHLVRMAG